MKATERYDAQTERDIAEWVPADAADQYRVRRKAAVARSFAQIDDAMMAIAEPTSRRMAEVSRQINESVERMRNSRP